MENLQPYQMLYPHLFEPIRIKGKYIRNRIICGPHGRMLNGDGVSISNVFNDYYGGMARGGAAIVNLFGSNVDTESGNAHGSGTILEEKSLVAFNNFTDHVHSFDSLACMEMYHCGLYSLPVLNGGKNALGPSAMWAPQGYQVDEMTEADMERIAGCFAKAAKLVRRSGFDMIMVHGGHSWLLSQFLSPSVNKRTDKYGGSLENRARFPIMVLDRIRDAIGDDLLIEYRMSATELTDGGLTLDESVEFAKLIQDKIDIIQCSAGLRANPFTRGIMHPSHFMKNGCNEYLAAAMKRADLRCKVTAIGAINDPALAEEILARGDADFVCMVRSFIADPYWAEKAKQCRADDIVPCIKCLRCLDVGGGRKASNLDVVADDFEEATRRAECSVNPTSGRAHFMFRYPAPKASRKVAIIGGGPAGLQAAITANERGHQVVLFEKSDSLGGQLKYADVVSFKKDVKRYKDYLIHQVEKRDIKVLLNTEATPELIRQEAPYAVIVATGATPKMPQIPGIDKANVINAIDVYGHEEKVGQKVAIIGGGFVGCETALHLEQLGRKVELINRSDMLIRDGTLTERLHTIYYLTHEYDPENAQLANAREIPDKTIIHMETKVLEITDKGVRVADKDGKESLIECDTVVISAGMVARENDVFDFLGTGYNVTAVGDAKKVGSIYTATTTGFDAAYVIF